MAFIKESNPVNAAEADSLYRGALAMEDTGSQAQALTLEFYARFLKNQGRDNEAGPISDRAQSVRQVRVSALARKHTAAADPIVVSGGMTPPKLVSKVEPSYTDDARASKIQGTVLLSIVVDTDGNATDIQLVRGIGYGLDEEAVKAINVWKFSPGLKGGVPVPVNAKIEVNFRLL
jgi:TonB family protein